MKNNYHNFHSFMGNPLVRAETDPKSQTDTQIERHTHMQRHIYTYLNHAKNPYKYSINHLICAVSCTKGHSSPLLAGRNNMRGRYSMS